MDIQRASDGQSSFVEDVGVNHGGADVLVAQEVLDGSDVIPVLQQVCGKAVTKGVAGDWFDDTGYFSGIIDCTVKGFVMKVMAAFGS